METQNINIKKYPKSANKLQCIGPCYKPKTPIVHPTLLSIMTNTQHPFCPVDVWFYEDPKTGKKEERSLDMCYNPTDISDISNEELSLNILLPYIDFNASQFLKIYYNIYSFEDSLDWINKNIDLPTNTKIRVMKSALSVFGKEIDIVDYRFINFLIDIIKVKYIPKIYASVSEYITMTNDEVSLTLPQNNQLTPSEYSVERTNYLMKLFLDSDNLNKFITRYFRYRKDGWDEQINHIENMISDLILYIINKINISIGSGEKII